MVGIFQVAPIAKSHSIGPQAEAIDAQGAELAVLPGNLTFEETPGGERVHLPVVLQPGQSLETFEDRVSGFAVAGDEARLFLENPDGTLAGTLLLELGDFTGFEGGAQAPVEEVWLVTPEVTEDFSQKDPAVGDVEVQIAVDLGEVPEGAHLKVDPELQVEAEQEHLFRQAAQAEGFAVKDFAYQVAVEKRNLRPEAATITLKVGPKWVEAQGGPDFVRIFRDDEQGNVTVLPTFYAGLDEEGHAVFVAPSPGLSVFALAAVEGPAKAPARAPSPPWGLLGVIAALGLMLGIATGSRGPPGGGVGPWLRLAMKASGELKEADQLRERKDGG